jgi:23S rRNA pseudouridine1911/1915/1917 synthase
VSRMAGRADVEARLDMLVPAIAGGVSRSRAAALIKDGAVIVDGRIVTKPSEIVRAGAEIVVDMPDPRPLGGTVAQDLPIRIVYQDDDVVVVDKEPGMVVHPGAGHLDGTLVNALLHHVDDLSGIGGVERPGIVHRLDRGTSGLLVVAKNDKAHADLAAQFAEHEAGRTYLALCLGSPREDQGTIRSLLGRHPKDRVRFASGLRGKEAITHWRVRSRAGSTTLIECRLETGRTHQVRVHLSEQGWPIVGDPLYGPEPRRLPAKLRLSVDPDRPLLHAWRLRFRHPADGRIVELEAPIPADFRMALAAAGLAASL